MNILYIKDNEQTLHRIRFRLDDRCGHKGIVEMAAVATARGGPREETS